MQQIPFKISSALKNVIGRDLITDDFIAVYELVKNSYDAHATEVVIKFEDDLIEITDNGKGMSFEDIKKKWLFVAYSAKRDRTEDKSLVNPEYEDYRNKIASRQYFAGAKGIGRFSCDRLGGELDLYTRHVGEADDASHVFVDWSKFEADPSREFIDVNVSYEIVPHSSFLDSVHGTTLRIKKLNAAWDCERIAKLKQSLERLINPFDYVDEGLVPRFVIRIEAPDCTFSDFGKTSERDKANGEVKNFVFEALDVKTTQIRVEIIGEKIKTKLTDRGQLIYEIEEPNTEFSLLTKELERVVFHLFYLNTAAKHNFTRIMGMQSVRFGSVFLFKNGFRVMPYGEYKKDLWGLDDRKTQGYARYLGSRELIGRIEIFGESGEFREVSSRDGGLVHTDSYQMLVDAFYEKGIRRLEKFTVDVQWADKELREEDNNREDTGALDNLDSKARIIKLIGNLVSGKDIKLIDYAKDFLNIVDERIEQAPKGLFAQLAKIAESTQDFDFAKRLRNLERQYNKSLEDAARAEELARLAEEERLAEAERRQKAEEELRIAEEFAMLESEERRKAELRAKEEEQKKKAAELIAFQEANQRKAAELRAQEETMNRKIAEEKRLEAEILAKERENERRRAELLAKEEERKRKEEEAKRAEAELQAQNASIQASQRLTQIKFLESVQSLEIGDVLELHHQIGIDANSIFEYVSNFRTKKNNQKFFEEEAIVNLTERVSFLAQKIIAVSKFTTKGGFLQASRDTEDDLITFIQEYYQKIYSAVSMRPFKVLFSGDVNKPFMRSFKPIEMTIVLDNLFSNSKKHKASEAHCNFEILASGEKLRISYWDNGIGLDKSIINPDSILERGFTTTNGSGLGLYHIKKVLGELNGTIHAIRGNKNELRIEMEVPK
jgi:hypothetical protein